MIAIQLTSICPDRAQHVSAVPLVFQWHSKLGANFTFRRGCLAVSGTSQMLQFSPLPCFFSLRGQQRAHGGCWFGWWAAWSRAWVLHMVRHSFVCSSLAMEIACSFPSRVNLLCCHIIFIPYLWSDTNVEKVNWMHMLFVGCITFALSNMYLFTTIGVCCWSGGSFFGAARGQVFSRQYIFQMGWNFFPMFWSQVHFSQLQLFITSILQEVDPELGYTFKYFNVFGPEPLYW